MRTNPNQKSELLAAKRRLELEMVMLGSDRTKRARALVSLQAETRKLKIAEKNISLELAQNTALIRKYETELQSLDAELARQKKKLNTLR